LEAESSGVVEQVGNRVNVGAMKKGGNDGNVKQSI